MNAPTVEDLLRLPEDEAVRRRLNGLNWEWLKLTAAGAGAVAFIALLAYLFASQWPKLIAPLVTLATARLVFMAEDEGWLRRRMTPAVVLATLGIWALLVAQAPSWQLGVQIVGILAPLVSIGLRLTWPWASTLLLAIGAGTLAPSFFLLDPRPELLAPRAAIQAGITVISLYFIQTTTQRSLGSFLRQFRVESSRQRERQRLRDELASARQIQLSMLPRSDPRVPGLDVSAASLPAAEVGGDYYEYFDQSADRFSMVVGDVAGHGVASGLLLSGIRSCLYLLHPDQPSPSDLFHKLDRMVRQTTARRMFITLLYVVFSQRQGQILLASAGHPPPLHFQSKSGHVDELALHAPPLGTRLSADYSQQVVPYEPGDVFLFYTDGLTEMADRNGDLYGDGRLAERFARAADGKDARAIREALLADVWNFKGDAEQLDDITMVVVRTLGPAS